jgi:hypothetical protein
MHLTTKARALLLAGFFASVLLQGCSFIPRTVEGLDTAAVTHLPLRAWLHNEGLTIRAVAGCFTADCPKVAVGLVSAQGKDADKLGALLRDPSSLLTTLRQADAADTGKIRKAIRTVVSAQPARVGVGQGFLMTMGDAEGARPPALIMVLGRWRGETLDAALIVAASEDALRVTAADVVRENWR